MIASTHTWRDNFKIVSALLRRDLYVLKSKITDMVIDGLIVVSIQTLQFGYFFPLFGLPHEAIAPIYIGMGIMAFTFFQGYSFSTNIVHMLPNHGPSMLEYHLTLPLPKTWLFAQYILYFIIETCIVTIPLVSIGFFALRSMFVGAQGSWLLFFATYLLVLLMFGIFFIAIPLHYDSDWFWNNAWPRRLSWFFNFSAIFFVWNTVNHVSPVLGKIFLLNPFTYAAEGLRSALLGGSNYIPLHWCIIALAITIGLSAIVLKNGIKKRLDPV